MYELCRFKLKLNKLSLSEFKRHSVILIAFEQLYVDRKFLGEDVYLFYYIPLDLLLLRVCVCALYAIVYPVCTCEYDSCLMKK